MNRLFLTLLFRSLTIFRLYIHVLGMNFHGYINIFFILGYIENMHVKGDKVILVHCPEYKSLVNSRK